jgi:hypothetical protein
MFGAIAARGHALALAADSGIARLAADEEVHWAFGR